MSPLKLKIALFASLCLVFVLGFLLLQRFVALTNPTQTNSTQINSTKPPHEINSSSVAIIMPHHDLLLPVFDDFYFNLSKNLANKQIKKVIILSPNHYQPALNNIVTEPETTQADHGVNLHLAFISRYFPSAKIESKLLTRYVPPSALDVLVQEIDAQMAQEPTLLLVSTDFSHYLPVIEAKKRDQQTQALICAKKAQEILHLSDEFLDCPACVYTLLRTQLVAQYDQACPAINFHSNSSQFSRQGQNVDAVTSYFVMEWMLHQRDMDLQVQTVPLQKPIRLLLGGDFYLDRYFRQVAQKRAYDFILSDLKDFLTQFDGVVVNLESPITSYQSLSAGSEFGSKQNYIFTSPPETASYLAKNSIKIVNLGNNHILNFGSEGFLQTMAYLQEAGVAYFGDVGKLLEPNYLIADFDKSKIAFINYNQFTSNAKQSTLDNIDSLKSKTDFVVVFAHWGAEYQPKADEEIQQLAHQLIDRGADIVIGSHPHVVQQSEVYKGKNIYYSLGNFVFDQYFSPETKRGLLLELIIDPVSFKTQTVEHSIDLRENGQILLN